MLLTFHFCPKVVPCNLPSVYHFILLKDLLILNHVYVCVSICCVCMVLSEARVTYQSQMVVSSLACTLGLELWSSGRGTPALHRWAASPSPIYIKVLVVAQLSLYFWFRPLSTFPLGYMIILAEHCPLLFSKQGCF